MQTYDLNWEPLRTYCQKLFQTQGVPEDEAFLVADCLVEADLCGIDSHGIARVDIYLKRLEEKVVNPVCELKIEQEHAASLAINACNSMGIVTGRRVMEKCIEKARQSGSCFATVNNSNHYCRGYHYIKMAAAEGMIGFTLSNTTPQMTPWGGCEKFLGTNPIGVAAPTNDGPIILDIASSVVAIGKITLAGRLGQSIPEGWTLTPDGEPTTDPIVGAKGSLLPFGGPKGSGIAVFVEIFCGILAGAQYGPYVNNFLSNFKDPQGLGQVFSCIDISKFVPLETFKERLGQMIKEMKALRKIPGVTEIFMPGEIEWKRELERRAKGTVPVPEPVYNTLKQLGEKYGVPFDF